MDIRVCLYVTVYAQNSSGMIHKELDNTHFSWAEPGGGETGRGKISHNKLFLYLLNFDPWEYINYFKN